MDGLEERVGCFIRKDSNKQARNWKRIIERGCYYILMINFKVIYLRLLLEWRGYTRNMLIGTYV